MLPFALLLLSLGTLAKLGRADHTNSQLVCPRDVGLGLAIVDRCHRVFHHVADLKLQFLGRRRHSAHELARLLLGKQIVLEDFLAADLIDAMHIVQTPMLLGRGVRLWDGLEGLEERYDIEAMSSPTGVTHLTFTRR